MASQDRIMALGYIASLPEDQQKQVNAKAAQLRDLLSSEDKNVFALNSMALCLVATEMQEKNDGGF